MTEKETDILMTRFLNGETTLAEERELAHALKSGHCPAEAEDKRTALLSMLPEDTEEPLPEGFYRRLYGRTDAEQDGKKARDFRPWYGAWGITAAAAVAACLLLLPPTRKTERENAAQEEDFCTCSAPSLEEALQQDARRRQAMERETGMLMRL